MKTKVRASQEGRLSPSSLATIGGCCGFFDLCSDQDLMSLSFQGQEPFLDWVGWEASDVCKIVKNFITFTRPEYGANGAPTPGYQADPCGDAYGVEWGACDFQLEDFGRLRRKTPVRDITKSNLRLCNIQPRYRLDGTPITDDIEFDLRITTEVNLQDLQRMLINGNHTQGADDGIFDGFSKLVNYGYVNSHGRRCKSMDSIVIDWNANDFDGGAGTTWNTNPVAATFNFIDVLLAVYRRIRQRLAMANALNAPLQPGDMIFVAPTHVNQCLLNAYTCWSVCPGSLDSMLVQLNTYEARQFRDRLNGGMFGAGEITLDGFTIPLMNYDWVLPKSPTLADAFLLTGRVGGTRLINGQYNNLATVPPKAPGWYDYTDGGRILTWIDSDGTCLNRFVEMQPRLLLWAPWAQARFVDLKCTQPGGFISPDPTETSFYIESSFSVAECPPGTMPGGVT